MDLAVKASKLDKVYRLYDRPKHRLLEALNPFGRKYHRDFFALKGVDLNIKAGESFGIIGRNGSGKSTLLQIIAGVLTPSGGEIVTTGKVAALLELGAGFNPEFTGRENVKFQCAILGYDAKETAEILPKVIEFAEIGAFVDQPVRTYSSGMYVRLAFSVAITVNPDILIIDEALAVGDIQFQAKCLVKVREFRQRGKTLLFVSHDPGAVKSLCDRAMLLDHGVVREVGDPAHVFDYYNALIAAEADAAPLPESGSLAERSGNGKVRINAATVSDGRGRDVETVTSGEPLTIKLSAKVHAAVPSVSFGILIRDRLGNDIYGTNTTLLGQALGPYKAGTELQVAFTMPANLGANVYTVTAAAHAGESHIEESFDWLNAARAFRVTHGSDMKFAGVCRLPATVKVEARPT